MNIAIVYYSFSGNTRAACGFLAGRLERPGRSVVLKELRLKDEERNFMAQGKAASRRLAPELASPACLPDPCDAVILGSPVWAFTFAPALRSFLAGCDLKGIPCACVLTCGAQVTSGNALNELCRAAGERGGRVIFSAYAAGSRCRDAGYLDGRFSGLYNLL